MANGATKPSSWNPNQISISFKNEMKAVNTQGFIKTLLERAGYVVQEFGIEKQLPEIKRLTREQYKASPIPSEVRTMPDLTAFDWETGAFFLVEVKFRRILNERSIEGLNRTLGAQIRCWSTTYTVLMISQPFYHNGTFHKDHMRVIPPDRLHLLSGDLTSEQIWNQLPTLPKVFPKLEQVPRHYLDFIARQVRDLGKT